MSYQKPEHEGYSSVYDEGVNLSKVQPTRVDEARTGRKGRVNARGSFQSTEAFKTARTNIDYSIIKEGCKIFTVTSSLMAEGKTTFSSNIAKAFAQIKENRVLLIDCDMRKPRVHAEFDLRNVPGLSNYLLQPTDLEKMLHWLPEDNLYILTSGVAVPTASELLSSDRFVQLLEDLSQVFDYIILDTPPVLVVSDALAVIPQTDGAVFVVNHNESTVPQLRDSFTAIENVNGKVLGTIMNKVPLKSTTYGKYGNYGNYGDNGSER